jgi:hypothetical protein
MMGQIKFLTPFADLAIQSICDAFLYKLENKEPEIPFEYLNLYDQELPELQLYTHTVPKDCKDAGRVDYYAQGQYLFLKDNICELKLVSDELRFLGIPHYAFSACFDQGFWRTDCENSDDILLEYVLWVPELKHMNRLESFHQ